MTEKETDIQLLADGLSSETERLMQLTKFKAFIASAVFTLVVFIVYHWLRVSGVIP